MTASIAFFIGLVVGACAGAFALAVVTERCYCEPEDSPSFNTKD